MGMKFCGSVWRHFSDGGLIFATLSLSRKDKIMMETWQF